MKYKRMGNSGLNVSAVGLGTNNFGMRMDYESTELVLKKCLDQGINFIDTANIYGGRGKSEEFIGQALVGTRDKYLLATKVSGPMGDGPNDRGNSRKHIMDEVENSLRRLQTDYIDLYQIHFTDPETPIDETIRVLDDLVHQGKVRYIGCSNFAGWQLTEALWTSIHEHLTSFISIQSQYSMLERDVEREVLPVCTAYDLSFIPYSPLAGGFLTGKYQRGADIPEGTRFAGNQRAQSRFLTDSNYDVLEGLEQFAQERDHTIGELAIAWLLNNSSIDSVISGATSEEQVVNNAKAAEWELTTDDMESLDEILNAK
ncbi:MAG: aldo/keto reductase [SAR202 cluster bacterium]|nr:aldo/keto reductase [SAR202 cluster bacterium]|tara:strand:+ start:2700 stop:3644 length:945 start_codon:yes stop_codon:yes gene_type:complete